jgi:putative addiction module component (TIGR02574 family)
MDDDAILALSPEERLDLIDRLWESLEPEHISLTPEQEAELDRRVALLDAGKADIRPWEEFKAELDSRYK